jgi:hypothetical protein
MGRLSGTARREVPAGPAQHPRPEGYFCGERERLRLEFLDAVRQLNDFLTSQTEALLHDDPDFNRFDILIQVAQQKKDAAKYAWIAHVEGHGCIALN